MIHGLLYQVYGSCDPSGSMRERDEHMFEKVMGRVCLAYLLLMLVLVGIHWWQDALGEDGAVIWSCHTMGNRQCGPGQPWLTIHWPTAGRD